MKNYLTGILFTFIATVSFAQMKGKNHSFHSKVFDKERKISVYLPMLEDGADTNQAFAVVYVFDGQFDPYTEMVRSITDYYAMSGQGMPVIVVGIHTEDRWGEFVPQIENNQIVPNQAAEKLSSSLRNEIFPLVDSLYKTKPFRIGVGHSLGGTFVFHEVIKEEALFQAVISVSPNLGMNQKFLVQKGKEMFERSPLTMKFIYMSVGTVGNPECMFKPSVEELNVGFQTHSSEKVLWYCDFLEGENHMTTFIPSFNRAYLELSSKVMLTELGLSQFSEDTAQTVQDKLKTYVSIRKSLTGEEQNLDLAFLSDFGKSLMEVEDYSGCIEMSKYTLTLIADKNELSKTEKQLQEKMLGRIEWSTFKMISKEAETKFAQKDYEAASLLYKKAFLIKDKRGTHMERIFAVQAFSASGDIEAAFEQLELLANYFELRGNGVFLENPLCNNLKSDPRWDKMMKKLAKNGKNN